MFNVFSNYLNPLKEAKIVELTEHPKPSEVYNQLRIAYNQGVKGIENCIRLFVPFPERDEELAEYIQSNVELMRVVRWTNRNVLLNLGKSSYQTLGVHVRIVGSMMIKLKESGKLREDVFYDLHTQFTGNVLAAHYEVSTEDLPF